MSLHVMVKAAYEGTGLYDENDEPLGYSDVPLTFDLYNRLDRWLGWYDQDFGSPDAFDAKAFSAEGYHIALCIKGELGADYDVWYYDEEYERSYPVVAEAETVGGDDNA